MSDEERRAELYNRLNIRCDDDPADRAWYSYPRDADRPRSRRGLIVLLALAATLAVSLVFHYATVPTDIPRSPISASQGWSPSTDAILVPDGMPLPPTPLARPVPPSPYLAWERDNAVTTPVVSRFLGDAEEKPPVGMTVELASITPMATSLLSKVLDRASLPAARVSIRHAGHGFAFPLWDYAIGRDGVLVPASARVSSALMPMLMLAILLWSAGRVHRLLEENPYVRIANLVHILMVGVGAIGLVALGILPDHILAVVPILFVLEPASQRRVAVLTAAATLAWMAETVPIEPPSDALAPLYGPLGVFSWDIVGLGALSALCLVATLRMPRQVVTVRVAAPLVQDVRIVER